MSDSVTKYFEDNAEIKTEKEEVSKNVVHILDLYNLLKPFEKIEVRKLIKEIKIF